MSSVAQPQPDVPLAEELVAYLDGELPPDECRRIEQRLAQDASYRQQLRELDQAWEALNALPAAQADDEFARTTIELVAVAAEGELSQHAARAAAVARRRTWQWAAVALAAATTAFIVAWLLWTRSDRALLAELPVIRQVDALSNIQDLEFLRQLARAVPLAELAPDESAIDDELRQLAAASDDSLRARRQWLEQLPTDQKASLAAQAQRFQTFTPAERDRLRLLERQIHQQPDHQVLQRYLIAYGKWLTRLLPGEQEELREALRELSLDKQVELVAQTARREREQASRRLSAEDASRLRQEVFNIVQQRRAAFEQQMRGRGQDREDAREAPSARLALAVLAWELGSEATRQRLIDSLSPEARQRIEGLRPNARRAQLWQWLRDALRPDWGPADLERFFANELTNTQREQLLNMPASEMQAHLERLYVAAQFGLTGSDQWWLDEPRGPRREPSAAPRPELRTERRQQVRSNSPPEARDEPRRQPRLPPAGPGPRPGVPPHGAPTPQPGPQEPPI